MDKYPNIGGEFFERIQKRLNSVQFDPLADPTRGWTQNSDVGLILDLDSSAFSGTKVGDAFDKLSFLGPAEKFTPSIFNCVDIEGNYLDQPKVQYSISYASRGVAFLADDVLKVQLINVYFQPDPRESGCGVFFGKVVWLGSDIGVSSVSHVDAVLSVLGKPDRDEEEPEHDHPISGLGKEPYTRWMWYEKPGAVWMIDFDDSGQTRGFGILQSRTTQP